MIQFILNEKLISTQLKPGTVLLDFIRYQQQLTGTKIGCREGDCGACTVLVGEMTDGNVRYRSVTSCLYPLGKADGKHIVTIEGLNYKDLTPVQEAMAAESATQCGFCTSGFVVSLSGHCLQNSSASPSSSLASIDGNICRCTGYKSIEKAALRLHELLETRKLESPLTFAIRNKIVPEYFKEIASRLNALKKERRPALSALASEGIHYLVGGGTDLYVQKHDEMHQADVRFLDQESDAAAVQQEGEFGIIRAGATITDLAESDLMKTWIPDFPEIIKLVSSTPIRNMATLAGNFVNASPIGDFTILFLALDTAIVLVSQEGKRSISLRNFYKGYKQLNKREDEQISEIRFRIPEQNEKLSFEKISKRTWLDIASVNSALRIRTQQSKILDAHLSAGGLGPIPLYLKASSDFLKGKTMNEELVHQVVEMAGKEISPISDTRGSVDYKRLLLRQQLRCHFLKLAPELKIELINSPGV